MTRITGLDVSDVRFPTSLDLDGSDAMNQAPDYSAAYLVLRTDDPDLAGSGTLRTVLNGSEMRWTARKCSHDSAGPCVGGDRVAVDAGSRHRVHRSGMAW